MDLVHVPNQIHVFVNLVTWVQFAKLLVALVFYQTVQVCAVVEVYARNQILACAMQITRVNNAKSHNALEFLVIILHKFAAAEVYAHKLTLVYAKVDTQVLHVKLQPASEYLQTPH